MLIQHLPVLSQHRIVLASASPRRLELLRQIGLNVEVQSSTFEEDLDKRKYTPASYAQATAREKAEHVARRTRGDARRPLLIVAADTVLVMTRTTVSTTSQQPSTLARRCPATCRAAEKPHSPQRPAGCAYVAP